NSSPRLAIDKSGRLWLAYRSVTPVWWNPVGTVWTEYVMSYDGSQWTGPVYLAHSDNVLDNRPALASAAPGQMTIVGSSDGRADFQLALRHGASAVGAGGVATFVGMPVQDPYNNGLNPGYLGWVGCCDHDNGGGREYTCWMNQKLTDLFYAPGRFAPIFSYERSVAYPEGHRNVLFEQRGVRTLPRLPKMTDDSTGKA